MNKIDIFEFHYHYNMGKGDPIARICDLLDRGEVSGILCCTDLSAGHEEFEARNAPLLELAGRRGKAALPLLAMIHINRPGWQKHATEWFDRWPELAGIKLHPPISNYAICPELVDPVFDFAAERDLIVASHTQPLAGQSAGAFYPSLRRQKKTKLVLYHGSMHEESAFLAESYANVYVEPTWLGFFPNLFQLMRKLGGYRKMLGGTDGPGWFDSFAGSPYADLIELARKHLPDEETVRDFCGRNAKRLLGIGQ